MSEETIKGFRVGDVAELDHIITPADIDSFVKLTGDTNPLHVDRRYAERTTFKGVVAHGMLGASFLSTIIGKHIPGDGALWLSQTLEFLFPVRVGDRIRVKAEVLEINARHRTLTLQTEIFNQHRQKVLTGRSLVKVLEVEELPIKNGEPSDLIPKVVIITGASRGIGAATAKRLARSGYAVVVNYRSDEEGALATVEEITAGGGNAVAFKADITNRAAVETMIKMTRQRFGAITALVNNATGQLIPKTFLELTEEDLEHYWNVQFKAPLHLIQAVLPSFHEAKCGAIVSISTIYTNNVPPTKLLVYTATKAALESATRSLAVEYGPQGFRFNVVSPGMTDTHLIADVPEKVRLLTKMQTPLRRLATPEDVANGVAFLLSEEARHITGETLRICGGTVMA